MAWPGASYVDKSLGMEQYRMSGSFSANGSSAISGTKGQGFTVARSTTGTYRISLGSSSKPTPFKALIAWTFGVKVADGTFASIKLLTDSSSDATAPYIDIANINTSGTPTDFTGAVSFDFVFGTVSQNA